jgi:transcriptional regulator with XRE-family HTH domain
VPKNAAEDTFGQLVRWVRTAVDVTQAQLAEEIGVSAKTVSRWEQLKLVPEVLQRPGIVAALGKLAPEYHGRLATVLDVAIERHAASAAGPNIAILKAALDGALFEATEKLGAPPATVREAVVIVLERVALLGVDAKTAAKLVTGKVG